jgi:hypothetical protein
LGNYMGVLILGILITIIYILMSMTILWVITGCNRQFCLPFGKKSGVRSFIYNVTIVRISVEILFMYILNSILNQLNESIRFAVLIYALIVIISELCLIVNKTINRLFN